jgi:hypothetical protein
VIIILPNFQPVTGYYEKSFNKEFSPETFSNNSPHGPYYILIVSAQTDAFFSKNMGYIKNELLSELL